MSNYDLKKKKSKKEMGPLKERVALKKRNG